MSDWLVAKFRGVLTIRVTIGHFFIHYWSFANMAFTVNSDGVAFLSFISVHSMMIKGKTPILNVTLYFVSAHHLVDWEEPMPRIYSLWPQWRSIEEKS